MKNRLAYKAGYKYQTHDAYFHDTGVVGFTITNDYCRLSKDGTLMIYKGYAWDGASWAVDTPSFMRGSLVHDTLYQLIGEDLLPFSYRRAADKLLIEICKDDGMWAPRRWWVMAAVSTFGARAVENNNPVLFAPEKP